MSGTGYVILAYALGGGLLWGYAIILWSREYKRCNSHADGGRS